MQQDNNTVRRVGFGQGWEQTTRNSAPEQKAVRVRSGTHLTTGQLIGEQQQPRAFRLDRRSRATTRIGKWSSALICK